MEELLEQFLKGVVVAVSDFRGEDLIFLFGVKDLVL